MRICSKSNIFHIYERKIAKETHEIIEPTAINDLISEQLIYNITNWTTCPNLFLTLCALVTTSPGGLPYTSVI